MSSGERSAIVWSSWLTLYAQGDPAELKAHIKELMHKLTQMQMRDAKVIQEVEPVSWVFSDAHNEFFLSYLDEVLLCNFSRAVGISHGTHWSAAECKPVALISH